MVNEKVLKFVKKQDIPDKLDDLIKLCEDLELKDKSKYNYVCNDGLDVMRYVLKEFGGLWLEIPKINNFKGLIERYIEAKVDENPRIYYKRLLRDTDISRSRYFDIIKNIKKRDKKRNSNDGIIPLFEEIE